MRQCLHVHPRALHYYRITPWNLPKTATCGPVLTDLYREVAALQKYVDCNVLVLFWTREAGCFREVAA